jgi:hypothetical protein
MPTVAINVQVTSIGNDALTFTIADNVSGIIATNVSRASLLGGIVVNADSTASQITIAADAPCESDVTIPIDFKPCGGPTPPPPPPPPPPPSNVTWSVANADCGYGVVYDVGINGNWMNSLDGPSTFPLTSTLYGTKLNPNGIVWNSYDNQILVHVTTNLPGNGNCGIVYVYYNNDISPTYAWSFHGEPFVTVPNVYVADGDNLHIVVNCYLGPCP